MLLQKHRADPLTGRPGEGVHVLRPASERCPAMRGYTILIYRNAAGAGCAGIGIPERDTKSFQERAR